MTQNKKILIHLEKYGSITALEALNEYGCMRLASRISDLREKGYNIITENETTHNRFGERVHIAKYILKED